MIKFAGNLYVGEIVFMSAITREILSVHLGRTVVLDLYIPGNLGGHETLDLLLLNDGQDGPGLGLDETLSRLSAEQKLRPLLVAAIHAGADRVQEYGVAGRPDFKGRGSKARQYAAFVTEELLPFIEGLGFALTGRKGFAGFSLGGLSAMDIVLHHPDLFELAGVFSGAFWWRSKDLKKGYTDADRIMHKAIRDLPVKTDQRFWIMAGTEDETADRNNNMIIDSIDDSIDVIKELYAKGYQRKRDVVYVEIVGGRHNVETWGRTMPLFLCWAFGR